MEIIRGYLQELQECIDELSIETIEQVCNVLFEVYKKGNQVFIMGNGGSASTAMHFARDLQIGTASPDKPRLRANCLADNMAFVTAIANDISYDDIFEEQLRSVVKSGDAVIGISASGNSINVLKGIEFANHAGAVTVGLIGFSGGKLKELADHSITLSSRKYQQIEDVHMVLAHIIPVWLKEKIAKA